MISKDVDLRSS